MAANAAIYFHEDGYRTDQPKLMGRHAAGEGFLTGFLRHARIDELVCFTEREARFRLFEEICAASGTANAGLALTWARSDDMAGIERAGTLYLPGPNLAEYAWARRRRSPRAWSLAGVTHTTASHSFMDGAGALATGAVEPWDAVVCTSTSVLETTRRLLDDQASWLKERLGATRAPRPQLPVIPLGVDCDGLDRPAAEKAAARAHWRRQLGIGEDDLVVLYVGRLSWHAKANPLAMYLGLEQATRVLGLEGRVHLVESGWHANDWIKGGFLEAQRALAPSIACHGVDGREPRARRGIWHAADIFCSLSDNIQETFGLTPVEAMAAGLPVIAADWDGYRETRAHGETALVVPTTLPPAAAGQALADRHADGIDNYDHYCAQASLLTAVDIGAVGEAFAGLLADGERRRGMGEAGRARARALYDWRVVIGAYQELWAELGAIRATAAATTPEAGGDPLRGNPLELFAHYPTRRLAETSRLRAVRDPPATLAALAGLRLLQLKNTPLDPGPLHQELLARLAEAGPRGLAHGELLARLPAADRPRARLVVGWLLKAGLIE
jgi:glycosyltransferase involved in cell wall biosynthesis